MKIISSKEVSCETIKVLYERGENYYDDIELKKKEGWKVVTKPNWYNEQMEIVMKSSSNGTVLTYVRYGHLNI